MIIWACLGHWIFEFEIYLFFGAWNLVFYYKIKFALTE